jgi:hypothetical protein
MPAEIDGLPSLLDAISVMSALVEKRSVTHFDDFRLAGIQSIHGDLVLSPI